MPRPRVSVLCLICVFAISAGIGSRARGSESSRKREKFKNAEVLYDWVTNSRSEKIRTIVTRPKNTTGKVPAIFFVGWLSCDTVEYADGETDGFGTIFWRLIEQGGFATMRMDKPGVGESEGNCATTDFQVELGSYRAAFEAIAKYPFVDPNAIFVVGLSNGGGTCPLIVGQHRVRGYVAASSWGRTWYEHMLENERARLNANKKLTAAEINEAMRSFVKFYALYLVDRLTPGAAIAQHPEWKSLWYDTPEGQYGRPAAFYQQLQDLNLGKVWEAVDAPVLVLHGTADTIMSASDSRTIADNVNRTHPQQASYVEINDADHLLSVAGELEPSVIPTMLGWMNKQLAER